MRAHSPTLLLCLCTLQGLAQIPQGGTPFGWGAPDVHPVHFPTAQLAELPEAERSTTLDSAGIMRYGVQRFISADVLAEGIVDTLPGDRLRCRFAVRSQGASMLSLQFDVFEPGPDVLLFLYDTGRTFYLGGFDGASRSEDGTLATAVIPGDEVIVEVTGPLDLLRSRIHIASVTHGLSNIFHFPQAEGVEEDRDYDPGYQSAACHVNVVCPAAAEWQTVKRATAMFLRPDGSGCTGTLLNNVALNGTPYFLIAHHCYQANTSQWVFYFNYESPTCVGSTGPTNQTITGATLKAGDYYDDFDLLQLSSTPPASYQPYYAGWDRSTNTPTRTVVIEHPLYDVKKIAIDNEAPTSYSNGSTQLWRTYWNSGIIESIASGSALYDQNKHLVGHLTEGPQTCATATSAPSGCVKFNAIWDGTTATGRVRDWLDPANTTMALDGYDPYSSGSASIAVRLKAMLQGPYATGSGLMAGTLRANGYVPLNEPYSALGYNHTGGGGELTTPAVLAVTGTASVVDWVIIELRNKNNSAQVVGSHSALILRNGSIVDVNGTSDVPFALPPDNYFIAVRHRNHLGVMTATARPLTSTGALIDLTSTSVAMYGTAPMITLNGTRCLYAGDVNRDGMLKYTGTTNDRDPLLVAVGGVVPNNTVSGYRTEDVNMNGIVSYTGANNDRDPILSNLGGTEPNAVKVQQLP